MKNSENMWLMTILKVTKNQGFTLSLEDTFLEKPQGGGGWNWPSLPFKEFTKLNKFVIVRKWLPSGASLYSLKRKKIQKNVKFYQLFYLKGLQLDF